jgi:hypothetical protein
MGIDRLRNVKYLGSYFNFHSMGTAKIKSSNDDF